MRETTAIIERVRRVGATWQHLELAIEPELSQIQPGQTLLARLHTPSVSYLREHWIPLGFNPELGVLVVERPLKSVYTPGDEVHLIGPVGSPFQLRRHQRTLLLLALDYPPSYLLHLLVTAIGLNMAVVMVLTGQAQDYPLSNLPPAVEVLKSPEPLQWAEQNRTLSWAEQVFAVCAPHNAEMFYSYLWGVAQQARRAVPEGFLQGIYPLPLPCGTGACLACLVRRKGADHLACIQGPAFDLAHIQF
jgi:hypothetical protein